MTNGRNLAQLIGNNMPYFENLLSATVRRPTPEEADEALTASKKTRWIMQAGLCGIGRLLEAYGDTGADLPAEVAVDLGVLLAELGESGQALDDVIFELEPIAARLRADLDKDQDALARRRP